MSYAVVTGLALIPTTEANAYSSGIDIGAHGHGCSMLLSHVSFELRSGVCLQAGSITIAGCGNVDIDGEWHPTADKTEGTFSPVSTKYRKAPGSAELARFGATWYIDEAPTAGCKFGKSLFKCKSDGGRCPADGWQVPKPGVFETGPSGTPVPGMTITINATATTAAPWAATATPSPSGW